MSLRAIGTWKESAWEYPMGRLAPKAVAMKRFDWESEAESAVVRGHKIHVGYWSANTVPVLQMEDLEYVAAHEKNALALLERLVSLATQGIAYLPPANAVVLCYEAVHTLLTGWIADDGYPETWEPDLQRAFEQGARNFQAQQQIRHELQAEVETDPVLRQYGLRVRIVPLTAPVLIA